MEKTLTRLIEELGQHRLENGQSALQALAKVIWNKALDGDRHAIQLVWERLEPEGGDPGVKEIDAEVQEVIDKVYGGLKEGPDPEGTG